MTTSPAPLIGWLVLDADGEPFIVRNATKVHTICDGCGSPAVYGMVRPDGATLLVGWCEPCLDQSRLDPRSPDQWFRPATA